MYSHVLQHAQNCVCVSLHAKFLTKDSNCATPSPWNSPRTYNILPSEPKVYKFVVLLWKDRLLSIFQKKFVFFWKVRLFWNITENPMFHGYRRVLKGFPLIILDIHREINLNFNTFSPHFNILAMLGLILCLITSGGTPVSGFLLNGRATSLDLQSLWRNQWGKFIFGFFSLWWIWPMQTIYLDFPIRLQSFCHSPPPYLFPSARKSGKVWSLNDDLEWFSSWFWCPKMSISRNPWKTRSNPWETRGNP